MKKIVTILMMLLVANVYGSPCPNLEGSYICSSGDMSWSYEVSQEMGDRYPEYTIIEDGEESTVIPDGIVHNIEDTPEFTNLSYSSFCQNSNLMIRIGGISRDGGYKMLVDSAMTKDKAGNLTMTLSGSYGDYPIPPQVTVCVP